MFVRDWLRRGFDRRQFVRPALGTPEPTTGADEHRTLDREELNFELGVPGGETNRVLGA